MSFYTAKAEISQGDRIQVRSGKRMLDATITDIVVTDTSLSVQCEVTGEAPAWVMEQLEAIEEADRERAERKASKHRFWRVRA